MTAVVRTERGQISGIGTDVVAYLGVPFAAPPIGDLRWKPPQKPAPWSGVRQCTAFGDDPLQGMRGEGRGSTYSEDCLTLNIWTLGSDKSGGDKRPVMVWFYGGGFMVGSASYPMYDGEALARKGVVVVTINYRLGIFGFMAHPALTAESPNHASGNYGFLDQVAALKWVRENIAEFGGDPGNVTIFGESAGACSVASHLVSPLSRGLFQKAILESPATLRKLYTLDAAEKAAVAMVGNDIVALRAMPAEELLPKGAQIGAGPGRLTAPQPIRMITDGWAFPEDERAALLAGRFAHVPMIVGGNEDEGSFFVRNMPVKNLADYDGFTAMGFGPFAEEARRLYPAKSDAEVFAAVSDFFADSLFNSGVRGLARLNAKAGAPTFRYLFTRRRNGKPMPPSHVEEVPYVFGNLDVPFFGQNLGASDGDRAVSAAMMGAWARFAATGDPNGSGLAWPAYDSARDNYLVFGDPFGAGAGWRTKYMDFFEHVFAATD
ncbi:MAG: carboxylesterase/lipase family protein [Stellaceae bacterium]